MERAKMAHMMSDYSKFNAFCAALIGTAYVMQWGGSHVWRVGGKVFAVGGWNDPDVGVTFKVSEIAFEHLKTQPGFRPAPYMASRGLSWIQSYSAADVPDADIRHYVRASYDTVTAGLPRVQRAALRAG